jgi:Spy/CpxP family protein refolding chaperone
MICRTYKDILEFYYKENYMKYVILVLLTASIALAQPGPSGGGRGCDSQGMCRMEKKLDLNADQQKNFEALRSEMQKKQIDLAAKVKTLRVDLRDLFDNDAPDQNSIEAKMTEISKLQNEMKLNHTDFWFSVNKILTAEQQKVWKESHRMCQPGMDSGREGRFGMRGGRGERSGGGRHRGH